MLRLIIDFFLKPKNFTMETESPSNSDRGGNERLTSQTDLVTQAILDNINDILSYSTPGLGV